MAVKRNWRDVNGYPNYRVSSDGVVENKKTGRVLKQCDTNSGYPTVNLYNNGSRKTTSVHRLVAETYNHGYSDDLEVNHKDGNKHNNYTGNLEWLTHSENEIHAHRTGLKHGPNRKAVRVVETGEIFESINECARAINGNDVNIGRCLKGDTKTHLGLTFEYADVDSVNASSKDRCISRSRINREHCRKRVRIVETGEEFDSIRECARTINGDQPTITRCLREKHKTHHGYHYEFI